MREILGQLRRRWFAGEFDVQSKEGTLALRHRSGTAYHQGQSGAGGGGLGRAAHAANSTSPNIWVLQRPGAARWLASVATGRPSSTRSRSSSSASATTCCRTTAHRLTCPSGVRSAFTSITTSASNHRCTRHHMTAAPPRTRIAVRGDGELVRLYRCSYAQIVARGCAVPRRSDTTRPAVAQLGPCDTSVEQSRRLLVRCSVAAKSRRPNSSRRRGFT